MFEGTGFDGAFRWSQGAFHPYSHAMGEECEKHFKEGQIYVLQEQKLTLKKMITWQQMKSLYLYLSKLSDELNDAGFDMLAVCAAMVEGFSVQCTKERLKQCVWDEIMSALFSVTSITKLTTKEVSIVYENVNKIVGEKFKVHVPWPDSYGKSLEEEYKNK